MREEMSLQTRRELLQHMLPQYREAKTVKKKSKLLDAFTETTGWQGTQWLVFDVDGTRQAARQRALPSTRDSPVAQRRLEEVCAPGYLGRKRGETVRTRTTVLQAHTHQWVGTFSGASGAGNGDYRGDLRQAIKLFGIPDAFAASLGLRIA